MLYEVITLHGTRAFGQHGAFGFFRSPRLGLSFLPFPRFQALSPSGRVGAEPIYVFPRPVPAPLPEPLYRPRITSYNVCYTKLLRLHDLYRRGRPKPVTVPIPLWRPFFPRGGAPGFRDIRKRFFMEA